MKITTVNSRLEPRPEFPEGSVQARITADLDRFFGVSLVPGVLDQILGHLHQNWNMEGFRVEYDPTSVGVAGNASRAVVYFDLPLFILELRCREHDWNDGDACPRCGRMAIEAGVQYTTDEDRLECQKCSHFFVQKDYV